MEGQNSQLLQDTPDLTTKAGPVPQPIPPSKKAKKTGDNTVSKSTTRITTLAMLAALAIVLVALVHFPLLPGAAFLEYDPADIPIFIGTFLFGPLSGLILTGVVSLIQGLTVSAGSGIIGIIMHFLATGTFVLIAGLLYRKHRTRKYAIIGLSVGTVAMTIVMCLCNLIFTPLFLGAPIEDVVDMLLPIIIPFNFLKAAINSIVTYIVYKPISHLVFREKSKQKKTGETPANQA